MPPRWPTPELLEAALLAVLQRADLTMPEQQAAACSTELIARGWVLLDGSQPTVAVGGRMIPALLPDDVFEFEVTLSGDQQSALVIAGTNDVLVGTDAEIRYSTETAMGVRLTRTGQTPITADTGAVFAATVTNQ